MTGRAFPTRRAFRAAVAGVVAAVAASLLPPGPAGARAQFPIPFPTSRDTGPARTGTGSITGRVVTDDASARPLRRVVVMLASGDLRGTQATTTDDEGRFGFAALPSGNYTITASRPGFVTAVYGSKQPGFGLGVPIAVFDDRPVTGLTVRMLPGAAITGVVRMTGGTPVSNVVVRAIPAAGQPGLRSSSLLTSGAGTATTDDRGVYRIFGLPPGRYVVQAQPRPAGSEAWRRVSDEEIRWATQAVSARAPLGAPVGAPAAAASPPPAPGAAVAMAPVYFPGTPDLAAARPIELDGGGERAGVDLMMMTVPIARVSGVVVGPDGAPMAGAQVQIKRLDVADDGDLIGTMMQMFGAGRGLTSGADGTFSLSGVTPGRYEIDVRAKPAGAKPAEPEGGANLMSLVMSMLPGGNAGGATLWGREPVDVAGVDLEGIAVRLREGLVVTGRVVVDGTAPPPPFAQVQVMLRGAASGSSLASAAASMLTSLTGRADADGAFSIRGVSPGRYQVGVLMPGSMFGTSMPGATWHLRSATIDGVDVADRPFAVGRDGVGEVVVTLTDRPTALSGTVYDQAGRPSSAFPIIVFSTDRERWTPGGRCVQQARPASDGTFRVVGLPPGDYYVSAVTDLALEDLYDPALLDLLVPGAIRLSLADGEQKVQDLKLAGGS
ncbi:MAG: carboxypeptidase-like regulatory domain-containing protein [Vicinamibacterales bacterium]